MGARQGALFWPPEGCSSSSKGPPAGVCCGPSHCPRCAAY